MELTHRTRVSRDMGATWMPNCSCGWRGKKYKDKDEAESKARVHQASGN